MRVLLLVLVVALSGCLRIQHVRNPDGSYWVEVYGRGWFDDRPELMRLFYARAEELCRGPFTYTIGSESRVYSSRGSTITATRRGVRVDHDRGSTSTTVGGYVYCHGSEDGCTSDGECKHGRLCVDGACESPSEQ